MGSERLIHTVSHFRKGIWSRAIKYAFGKISSFCAEVQSQDAFAYTNSATSPEHDCHPKARLSLISISSFKSRMFMWAEYWRGWKSGDNSVYKKVNGLKYYQYQEITDLFLPSWMGRHSQCRIINNSLLFFIGSNNMFTCVHTALILATPGSCSTYSIKPSTCSGAETTLHYSSWHWQLSSQWDLRLLSPFLGGVSRGLEGL